MSPGNMCYSLPPRRRQQRWGNRSNSGSSSGSDSSSGSGEAADADDGGAGQLPRLEANRLKWTISPPNLALSRTRGATRRLAEADSVPPIDDIALEVEALLTESECTESEKGIAGHEFDDMWEMFGSSGSQRWSESKNAQMDDFTDLFSFKSGLQEGGNSDGVDNGGTALTVDE